MMTVYVLEGANRLLYIGITKDLAQRYAAHCAGKCKTSSRLESPRIIHTWIVANRYIALKVEKLLQALQRRFGNSAIFDIILDCPILSKQLVADALNLPDTPYELKFK